MHASYWQCKDALSMPVLSLVEPQLYPKQSLSLSRLLLRDGSSGVALVRAATFGTEGPQLKKNKHFFQLRNLLQQCLQGCFYNLSTLWPNRIIPFLS